MGLRGGGGDRSDLSSSVNTRPFFCVGYREAQCGLLLVERGNSREKRASGVSRAQCLCIYSTLRGIVEVSGKTLLQDNAA